MGKKAKAKKELREKINDELSNQKVTSTKKQKIKKKLKKELKKKLKTAEKHPLQNLKLHVDEANSDSGAASKISPWLKRLFQIGLLMICISVFLVVGYFGYFATLKIFRPTEIARLLPSESTVLSFELNINPDSSQYQKSAYLLQRNPYFEAFDSQSWIMNFLGISSFKNEVWVGRNFGLAVLKDGKEYYYYYFLESKNKKKATTFLQKNYPLSNDKNIKKYQLSAIPKADSLSFPTSSYVSLIEDYLIFSNSTENLDFFYQNYSTEEKLYSEAKYRRADDNLPQNRNAFLYLNYELFDPKSLSYLPESIVNKELQQYLSLFSKNYLSEGFALIALEDKFAIQSFLNVKTDNLPDKKYLSFAKTYQGKLLKLLSIQPDLLFGGQDLTYYFNSQLSFLPKETQNLFLTQLNQEFDSAEVQFEEELLPLFQNEYLLAINLNRSTNQGAASEITASLFLETLNAEADSQKVTNLVGKFLQKYAGYTSELINHRLPDGTISYEFVAVPEELVNNEENFLDTKILSAEIPSRNLQIFVAPLKNYVVVSNRIENVKNVLEKSKMETTDLFQQNTTYQEFLEPLIYSADQINFFNIQKFADFIPKNDPLGELISQLKSFSTAKNYFNDGVVTINFFSFDH